jgi:hypothetical protein
VKKPFRSYDSKREVSGWRDHYEQRVRAEGKERAGCGGEKGEGERRLLTQYAGKCSVCGGVVVQGDWVYWDQVKRKVRHAPSGYKKPEPIEGAQGGEYRRWPGLWDNREALPAGVRKVE